MHIYKHIVARTYTISIQKSKSENMEAKKLKNEARNKNPCVMLMEILKSVTYYSVELSLNTFCDNQELSVDIPCVNFIRIMYLHPIDIVELCMEFLYDMVFG